jgi:hypothetical protein
VLHRVIAIAVALAAAAVAISALHPLARPSLPHCSDCAYAARGVLFVQLADRGVARQGVSLAQYGWIYVDGKPLEVNQSVYCEWANVVVRNGIAYVSCGGVPAVPELEMNLTVAPYARCFYAAYPVLRAAVFYGENNTEDLRPNVQLKAFDLTPLWEEGLRSAAICASATACFKVSDVGACPDFLLAWEHQAFTTYYGSGDYADEVWRLYRVNKTWHLVLVAEDCRIIWQEVWANGVLVRVCGKSGPKSSYYSTRAYEVLARFVSQDPNATAAAKFTVRD